MLSWSPSLGDPLRLHPESDGITLLAQLFTCHLIHWTPSHLFYDALCFAAFCLVLDLREAACCVLVASPIVSLTVLLLHPELSSYGGLSGINCALFSLFALQDRHLPRWGRVAALGGILLKTLVEILSGRVFFATEGFRPIHAAHLAGIGAGLLVALVLMASDGSFLTQCRKLLPVRVAATRWR